MKEKKTLDILQYNVRKSKDTVMATLLRDERVLEYDIIAIQEPWRNPFMTTTHHPAKDLFHLCYPTAEGDAAKPARVCFFVNKRLDETKWKFTGHTGDLCTIQIQLSNGDHAEDRLEIHNVYNPGKQAEDSNSTIHDLRNVLATSDANESIALGDFNLHHQFWGGQDIRQADSESEYLIEILEEHDMDSMLQPGTITYKEGGHRTTIDLCWVTLGLQDRIIKVAVDKEFDHDSDHLPITIALDLSVAHRRDKQRRNWRVVEDDKLRQAIKAELPDIRKPRTRTALDEYVRDIVRAIQTAANKVLPLNQPTRWAREGWDESCKQALAETKRLRRIHTMLVMHHAPRTLQFRQQRSA